MLLPQLHAETRAFLATPLQITTYFRLNPQASLLNKRATYPRVSHSLVCTFVLTISFCCGGQRRDQGA